MTETFLQIARSVPAPRNGRGAISPQLDEENCSGLSSSHKPTGPSHWQNGFGMNCVWFVTIHYSRLRCVRQKCTAWQKQEQSTIKVHKLPCSLPISALVHLRIRRPTLSKCLCGMWSLAFWLTKSFANSFLLPNQGSWLQRRLHLCCSKNTVNGQRCARLDPITPVDPDGPWAQVTAIRKAHWQRAVHPLLHGESSGLCD